MIFSLEQYEEGTNATQPEICQPLRKRLAESYQRDGFRSEVKESFPGFPHISVQDVMDTLLL